MKILVLVASFLFATTDLLAAEPQVVQLRGDTTGPRFEGIGAVNGGGATSVLLKDYPEPQRSEILDLVYKPKFGASVSALLVEIPGDGNSTQGSMPSHMHSRDDLNYSRGYTWWVLQEAKRRNPNLSLDAAGWSAPGWIGNGNFWSQDGADYYVKWLQGLRDVYGLRLDAIGCRNERGVDISFAKKLRASLDKNGFQEVMLHAFDNWPDDKFEFVQHMLDDPEARDAIDAIGAHVLYGKEGGHASAQVQAMAARLGKPIWNTEDHVYKKGFECEISIVECFNDNFIHSGATRIINWYDIGGVYPLEPYAEDPPMVIAQWPWSGHYRVRQNLWGYAHYGQFAEVGWQYLKDGCLELTGGGSCVALKSPDDDYSIIIETKDAKSPQQVQFEITGGLSTNELCVWRSNAQEQFIQQAPVKPVDGKFTLTVDPETIYSLSTTRGQQKGSFAEIPAPAKFPFPYYETFESYADPKAWGYLPRYTADIEEVFELAERPDGSGTCLRQVVASRTSSWGPDWQPYTILGDRNWGDYQLSADVYLNPGDTAGVMGRINFVGWGYGTIPKGYYVTLSDSGECRLVVVRGKIEKKELVGDAEQQELLNSLDDDSAGGERELAAIQLPNIHANEWHNLRLSFEGTTIKVLVDEKEILAANNSLYFSGMAGLTAGAVDKKKLSTPYFDNLVVRDENAPLPVPTRPLARQTPLYSDAP